MLSARLKQFTLGAACCLVVAGPAWSAEPAYPGKPVRVIVPQIAGGINDVAVRLVTKKMGEYLGQPFIVENRAGGDTIIGTRAVKDAAADGYTLLGTHNGFSALPALKDNAGYAPVQDFRGIGPIMQAPFILDVPGDQPYKTLPDFITHAKAAPDKISFASPGFGTPNHIATEIFFRKTGIKGLTHVPFKGAAAAVIEVAGGRIPFYVDAYVTSAPHFQSGKIRPLAVTSAQRIPALPNVPTLQEQGIDFVYEYWLGLLAPKGTPDAVVKRLSDALRFAANDPELQQRYRAEGAHIPFMAPAEFDSLIRREVDEVTKLMNELGVEKQ